MPGSPPASQSVNERTASKKVSIIVPVYNVEPYLKECLASCVHQTLKEIEIICINDGSTDRSLEILKEYQKSDHRIRIIDKPNGGLSSARNAGIRAAHGEWLVFLDSDDILAENACERILRERAEGPTDIVVFGATAFSDDAGPNSGLKKELTVCPNRFSGFRPEILFKTNGSIPYVWRQSFRRKFLLDNNLLFDEEIPFGEDAVFQLEAFPCANNFSYIPDVLYQYRWSRPGSLMATFRKDRAAKLEQHLLMIEHVCRFWKEKGWFSLYGAEFTRWVIDFIVPDTQRPDVHNGILCLKKLYHILEAHKLIPYLSESSKNAQPLLHGIQAGLFFRPEVESLD